MPSLLSLYAELKSAYKVGLQRGPQSKKWPDPILLNFPKIATALPF